MEEGQSRTYDGFHDGCLCRGLLHDGRMVFSTWMFTATQHIFIIESDESMIRMFHIFFLLLRDPSLIDIEEG